MDFSQQWPACCISKRPSKQLCWGLCLCCVFSWRLEETEKLGQTLVGQLRLLPSPSSGRLKGHGACWLGKSVTRRLSGWDDGKDIQVPWRGRSDPQGREKDLQLTWGSRASPGGEALVFSPAAGSAGVSASCRHGDTNSKNHFLILKEN